MATITLTAAQVAAIFPLRAEIYDYIADEAVDRGQAGYVPATGGIKKASAAASGTAGARGLILGKAGTGQGVSVLRRGHVAGFDVSGLAYDAPIYLGDTVGTLDTAAGTVSVQVGRVTPLSDSSKTKVIFFDFPL